MYFPRYISLGYVCLLFSLLNPTRVLFALHFGLEKDRHFCARQAEIVNRKREINFLFFCFTSHPTDRLRNGLFGIKELNVR
jgi:hypothetical protein